MSLNKNRLKILNVWVDPVDMGGALERVERFVEEGDRPHSVFAVNPEKNFSVPRDPQLHKVFSEADLLIPDGIGVVMAARILYRVRLARVPGVEMMEEICRLSARKKYKIFIYGAKEEVSVKAAAELQKRYPDLEIVGRANGYVSQEGMPDLIDQINASGAQVLFLALGSPRQENWYATYADKLHSVRVCQGIGGTLDTIAGNVKRAPQFWCRLNLEWFYRLMSEPKRIARQKVLPVFAYMVLRRKLDMVLH